MTKEHYIEEPLSEDEKIQAKFNVDSLISNVETSEFDLGNMNKQFELRIPQRKAGIDAKEAIREKEIELSRFKDQLKMYERRVRTGNKKIPTAAPEEVSTEE